MSTVEERLASLEARMDAMSDVRNLITELRGDMNARFIDVSNRFTELREDINRQFAEVDRQFAEVDRRFGDVDRRFGDMNGRFDDVNRRLAALDEKGDRHFTWMVSTQVALLLAVVGALVGTYYR
jgi:hypothetical protein